MEYFPPIQTHPIQTLITFLIHDYTHLLTLYFTHHLNIKIFHRVSRRCKLWSIIIIIIIIIIDVKEKKEKEKEKKKKVRYSREDSEATVRDLLNITVYFVTRGGRGEEVRSPLDSG